MRATAAGRGAAAELVLDNIVLVEAVCYVRSTAALRILRRLSCPAASIRIRDRTAADSRLRL